jgi:peptidoglycan/xylan/chitin deacetylase (PgdA/CDA1 family)
MQQDRGLGRIFHAGPASGYRTGPVDAENSGRCSITIDVEEPSTDGVAGRFGTALLPLLTQLEAIQAKATFFVVGSLAPSWSEELRRLASDGHEIALHGHTHRFVNRLSKYEFSEDVKRGVDALHACVGVRPVGFRAPYFSITSQTPWAADVLLEAEFLYSSSVLPAWNPQVGYPGAPRATFRWGNGLIEFPVPVFGLGPFRLPLLGGAYIRLAPLPVVRRAVANRRKTVGCWAYAHPYDFDVDEPFKRLPGQPWWVAKLLFMRRHLMLDRIVSLTDAAAPTLSQLAGNQRFRDGLATFG